MPLAKMRFILFLLLAGMFVSAHSVWSDSIKERMLARLPVIKELKAQGLVGENNKGFLEYRTGKKTKADVIQAENQDRSEVYKAIATRQNTSADFVGQTRAAQIASNEPPGVWIQSGDGTWTKK
ncbi:MAG: YdbL family protein [Desulfomicrobium sp.]|nr:YdbL family protein [Desulfomicrobium sp.]NLV96077.1 YdbL family protein [Desulfovibrionales bacterium]